MSTLKPAGWKGIYSVETQAWGNFFGPMIFFDNGTMTLAGNPVSLTKSGAAYSFDWTEISTPEKTTTAKGFMEFGSSGTGGPKGQFTMMFSGSINPRRQDGPVSWNGKLMFGEDGKPIAVPSSEMIQIGAAATRIGQEMQAGSHKRDPGGILTGLMERPEELLVANGIPSSVFSGHNAADYTAMLASQADRELNSRTREPHWWRCWPCRVGFGAVFAGIGVIVAAATGGLATVAYAAAIAYASYIFGAVAVTAVNALAAAGAFAGAGGLASVIELICEAIPDTC